MTANKSVPIGWSECRKRNKCIIIVTDGQSTAAVVMTLIYNQFELELYKIRLGLNKKYAVTFQNGMTSTHDNGSGVEKPQQVHQMYALPLRNLH